MLWSGCCYKGFMKGKHVWCMLLDIQYMYWSASKHSHLLWILARNRRIQGLPRRPPRSAYSRSRWECLRHSRCLAGRPDQANLTKLPRTNSWRILQIASLTPEQKFVSAKIGKHPTFPLPPSNQCIQPWCWESPRCEECWNYAAKFNLSRREKPWNGRRYGKDGPVS